MGVVMPTRGDFGEDSKLIAYLAHQLNAGKIAMFPGAGVSAIRPS